MNDAIRELVANAIDEHLLAHIPNDIKIIYNDGTKTLIISDEGRGIKSTHFIENINKEKLNNPKVFGKLGINLKNAIAVLVNNHINVTIKSDFGIYTPVISAKQGLNDQISTIHIERQNSFNEQKGTIISLSPISQQEADQANNLLTL
ncbi:ATP-binding protein [bacterium]|nr:ATP-binding protein [bacterium]